MIVKLFLIIPVEEFDQVPVPFNTKEVVPEHVPVEVVVRFPDIFIALVFNVGLVAELTSVAFVTFKVLGTVVIPVLTTKGPVGLKVKAPLKLKVPE